MDPAKDIAEFLTSRRAKVTPEQVGLPTYGARRVKGLRREEVASLAGVSVEYYRRLERGNVSGVSEGVTAPIIGPRTMEHLESQLAAADVGLDAALLDRIDELVPPGTNVNPADGSWHSPALAPAARRRSRKGYGASTCSRQW